MLWLTYQIAFFEFKKLKANDKKKNGATEVAVVETLIKLKMLETFTAKVTNLSVDAFQMFQLVSFFFYIFLLFSSDEQGNFYKDWFDVEFQF